MPALVLALGALLLLPFPLTAQVDEELVDDWFIDAARHLERGRDRRALTALERVLEALPDDTEALALAIPAAFNVGELETAERLARHLLDLAPGARDARLLLARALIETGRPEAAEEVLQPLLAARPTDGGPRLDFPAQALLAHLRERRGQDAAAREIRRGLVDEAKRVVVKAPRDLVALAEAYVAFGGAREAEEVLVEAQERAGEEDEVPSAALGRLYLENFYLQGDAVEEFRRALEIHPWRSRILWDLHRAYADWGKGPRAEEARREALAIHPKLVPALVAKGAAALGNIDYEAAEEAAAEALELRPDSRQALALRAAIQWMKVGPEAGREAIRTFLAVDPTYATGLVRIAEILNQRRRWPEALDLCRQATEIDPDDAEAWDARARYAFFLGLDLEGHEALRRADRTDRFSHPWRKNMFEVRRVLDLYYVEHATERFLHRFHKREAGALVPYVDPFAARSFEILSERYAFDPEGLDREDHEGKILVEWFKATGDFSARTLGFSNFGALGVCFGPFIGMNSPGARQPGEFSWARTFHHELAHTMTVGLSKGRTPRWLTEGLSTYEETAMNPSWDRGLYRDLHDALETGTLFEIRRFDAGFATPRVIFAYFQGGLAARLLIRDFGIEKVRALLRAYGEDRLTPDAFQTALGITPEDFDRRFEGFVREILEGVHLRPRTPGALLPKLERAAEGEGEEAAEARVRLAEALADRGAWLDALEAVERARRPGAHQPRLDRVLGRYAMAQRDAAAARAHYARALEQGFEDFDIRVDLARLAEAAGDSVAAKGEWTKALEAFPLANRGEDPRLPLARIAGAEGEVEEEIRLLEEHLARAFESLPVRTRLIELYRERGEPEREIRHLEAVLWLDPLERGVHERLAELYLAQDRAAEAVREREVVVALLEALREGERAPDTVLAGAHVALAEALLAVPEREEAAEEAARKALEIVPDHQPARDLLERLESGHDGGSGGR